MSDTPETMRALRFHAYGDPADVLVMESVPIPAPDPGRIRVVVHACGLNPADWALCRGLFAGLLPRGIGLDVSGIVDAIGSGVDDVAVGDAVLGAADYAGSTSAGAADRAILKHWTRVPKGLDLVHAAALTMAVETAYRSLDNLRVGPEHTLLVHGSGTTVGFAAVQIALMRGARVIATAGNTYAERLRTLGAKVTAYGPGMVERILELAGGAVHLALDTGPISGALPELLRVVDNDGQRLLTISDHAAAVELGVRHSFSEGGSLRYDVLGELAQHAAEGRFFIPIGKTYALDDWRAAVELSESGKAHGKLMLLPDPDAV